MAHVRVVRYGDSATYVELRHDDDSGMWDGSCTWPGCGWTVVGDHGRLVTIADAEQSASIHIDNGH